jgi:hypothetical protein
MPTSQKTREGRYKRKSTYKQNKNAEQILAYPPIATTTLEPYPAYSKII